MATLGTDEREIEYQDDFFEGEEQFSLNFEEEQDFYTFDEEMYCATKGCKNNAELVFCDDCDDSTDLDFSDEKRRDRIMDSQEY
jgi:hypothetical protein